MTALADAAVKRGGRLPSAIIELVSREPERGPDREQHFAWRHRISNEFDGDPVAEIARLRIDESAPAQMLKTFARLAPLLNSAHDGGALRAMRRQVVLHLEADQLQGAVSEAVEALLAAERPTQTIGPDRPVETPDAHLIEALVTDPILNVDALPARALALAERAVARLVDRNVPVLAPQQALRGALAERLGTADATADRAIEDILSGQTSTREKLRNAATALERLKRSDLAALVEAEWLRVAAEGSDLSETDDVLALLALLQEAAASKLVGAETLGLIYSPSVLKLLRDEGERLDSRASETYLDDNAKAKILATAISLVEAAVRLDELVRPEASAETDLEVRSRAYNLLDRMLSRQSRIGNHSTGDRGQASDMMISQRALNLFIAARDRNQLPRGGHSPASYRNNVASNLLRRGPVENARVLLNEALGDVRTRLADPEIEPSGELFWSIDGVTNNLRETHPPDEAVAITSGIMQDLDRLPVTRLMKGHAGTLGAILRNATYIVTLAADRHSLIPNNPQADACDRYAAHPNDPMRAAPGVLFAVLEVAKAVKACEAAVRRAPREVRYAFQLARVLERSAELTRKGADDIFATRHVKLYKKALDQKYPIAFNNYSTFILKKSENEFLQKHIYYYNRTIAHLGERLAASLEAEGGEPNLKTAAWLRAERAAAIARPEAHRLVERWRQAQSASPTR